MKKYYLILSLWIGLISQAFSAQTILLMDTNDRSYYPSSIIVTNGAVITSTNSISPLAVQGVTNTVGVADAGKIVKLNDSGQINTNMLSAAFQTAFTSSFTSTNIAFVSGSATVQAHGLGAMPSLVQMRLKCTTAEIGYSIGDEVIIQEGPIDNSAEAGINVVPDASNLNIRFGTGGFVLFNPTAGTRSGITTADWKLIIRAWK